MAADAPLARKERRAPSIWPIVVLLAALLAGLPVAWQLGWRYRLDEEEVARVDARWAELESWAQELDAEDAGDANAQTAAAFDALLEAAADAMARDPINGGEATDVAQWSPVLERLRAWDGRVSDEALAAHDTLRVRAAIDLARVAFTLDGVDDATKERALALGAALRRRGAIFPWMTGIAVHGAAVEDVERGGGSERALLEPWKPRPEELVAAYVREAVALERTWDDGDEHDPFVPAALASGEKLRHLRHRYRDVLTELLLPQRDAPADLDALRRRFDALAAEHHLDDRSEILSNLVSNLGRWARSFDDAVAQHERAVRAE